MNKETNYVAYLKSLSAEEREGEIESKISETEQEIMNAEAVSREIASSNALGCGIDITEILGIDVSHPDQIRVSISFSLCGNQDDDKPFTGTTIDGEATAIIDDTGRVHYRSVTAKRDLDGEDDKESL